MASWVITISKDFPQHWDYAREHGVWDMPKHFPVSSGDFVYFRFGGGGGLIGQTEATSDARPLATSDMVPWDDGSDPYTTRFTFRLIADAPLRADRWATISAQLTKQPTLQAPRSWNDPLDETVLASYFGPSLIGQSPLEGVAADMALGLGLHVPDFDMDMSEDEKKFVAAFQVVRQGQRTFRDRLYDLYGACAITGTAVKEALDAAPIRPYSGPKSNIPPNGMPLRSDLHQLFDRHLITVTLAQGTSYLVRTSPTLGGSPYAVLERQGLHSLPDHKKLRPHADFLAEHNAKCDWLTP